MKIKSLTIALIASLATVLGTSSCSSDDDEPEAPVATQVAGSYTGNEVIMVDNEESSNETKTSSKGGGGLEEELPPPDPEGARAFKQR